MNIGDQVKVFDPARGHLTGIVQQVVKAKDQSLSYLIATPGHLDYFRLVNGSLTTDWRKV